MRFFGFFTVQISSGFLLSLAVGSGMSAVPARADTVPSSEHVILSGEWLPDGRCRYQIRTNPREDGSAVLPNQWEHTLSPGEVQVQRMPGGNPSFLAFSCGKDGLVISLPRGDGEFETIRPKTD